MSIKLLDKHEQKLKLRHVKRRFWERSETIVKQGKAIFKVPVPPKTKTTYYWMIEPPTVGNEAPRPYTVKYTPSLEKRAKIPERMYNQKRSFQLRRDARINYADALFQPVKKPKDEEETKIEEPKEWTEADLRQYKEYQTFFESWDEAQYTEEEMYDLMQSAINDRIEIYQEVYKMTSNEAYLGQAIFFKFLDLERLSDLHRMYLVLSQECDFSIAYVEMILRRHYE